MRTSTWKAWALGAAMLVPIACDDAPIEPDSEDVAHIEVQPRFAVVQAGAQATVAATPRNEAGLAISPSMNVSTCDDRITASVDTSRNPLLGGRNILITAQTLGLSCVVVSAGGAEDTIDVSVVPTELLVSGPDPLPSGEAASLTMEFRNIAGGVAAGLDAGDLVFTSSDPAVVFVDETGTIQGRAPGTAEIEVALAESFSAVVADTFSVTVEPGTFTGTVSPAAAEPSEALTLTAGTLAFDEDTEVTFPGAGGNPQILSRTETEIRLVVPCGASGEFLVTGLGPDQVASIGTYTTTAPDSLTTVPFVGCRAQFFAAGSHDHFYDINVPAEGSYTATLTFPDGADLDMYLIQDGVLQFCSDDTFGCATATGGNPETVTVTIPAGEYELYVNLFDAGGLDVVEYEVSVD